MKIDKIIDFNSRKEVQNANDIRHTNIRRPGHLPPKKPGSHDIAYIRENLDWVIKAHHEFAEAEPKGTRIPLHILTTSYNARFQKEHRTEKGLSSWIERTEELKKVRDSYKLS
jgi:hypothetical protein